MRVSLDRAKGVGGSILEVTLGIFVLAMLVTILSAKESRAETRTLATAKNVASSNVSAMLPLLGTICIVDDSNGYQLTFDPNTGAYTFTNCTSFTLMGIGKVKIKGCTITLEHIALDRRVMANVELCVKRATASAQTYVPSSSVKTIVDRNTSNDVCGCVLGGG